MDKGKTFFFLGQLQPSMSHVFPAIRPGVSWARLHSVNTSAKAYPGLLILMLQQYTMCLAHQQICKEDHHKQSLRPLCSLTLLRMLQVFGQTLCPTTTAGQHQQQEATPNGHHQAFTFL
jgi:hypothetical protein